MMLNPLRLALSTLTRLPGGPGKIEESDFKNSFVWFPLVGGALGLALWGMSAAAHWAGIGNGITAFFLLLFLAMVTGGLHLDGLSDTADAFFSGKGREEMLRIMKESCSGPFGNAAVTLVLIGKYAALLHLLNAGRETSVIAALAFSRWGMVVASFRAHYPRPGGTGMSFIGKPTFPLLAGSLAVAAAVSFPAAGWRMGAAFAATLACTLFLRREADSKIGGVTGDVLGAVNETAELAALLAL